MAAITGGGVCGVPRRVVSRTQHANYVLDVLECGHEVADHDNRTPQQRRCMACAEQSRNALPSSPPGGGIARRAAREASDAP